MVHSVYGHLKGQSLLTVQPNSNIVSRWLFLLKM